MNCIGLLGIVMHCFVPPPVALSDYCNQQRADEAKMQHFSDSEIAALTRPHREAILSERWKFRKFCTAKKP